MNNIFETTGETLMPPPPPATWGMKDFYGRILSDAFMNTSESPWDDVPSLKEKILTEITEAQHEFNGFMESFERLSLRLAVVRHFIALQDLNFRRGVAPLEWDKERALLIKLVDAVLESAIQRKMAVESQTRLRDELTALRDAED